MPEEDSTVRINGVDCRNFKEMILYKMDRTIAIVGIIILGVWAMAATEVPSDTQQVTTAAITALATYLGGKIVK